MRGHIEGHLLFRKLKKGEGMKVLRKLAVLVAVCGLMALTQAATASADNVSKQRTKQIICQIFGRYCKQAISVANCETGGTFSVYAGEGKHQYHGLFQMGSWERRTYGHGYDAWAQARAAYRYFVATGRDWSPWQCRPGGWLAW